jgi:serralysin
MATPDSESIPLLTPVNNGGSQLDEFISGLVQGGSWTFGGGPRVLTYSLNINELTGTYPGTPEPGDGGPWSDSPGMAVAVAKVLARWSDVADIQFQRIDSGEYYFESTADFAISLTGDDLDSTTPDPSDEVLGAAVFPDEVYVAENVYTAEAGTDRSNYPAPEGDVFLDNFDTHYEFLAPGGAGFAVILHELGHALGLKHPFDDGANGRPSFDELGIPGMDAMRHTIMSKSGFLQLEAAARGFAATPMPLDILAIQHIYGANMTHHAGDDSYALANTSYRTIWDAGGTDVLSAATWSQAGGVTIDLRGGAFSGRFDGAKRMAIAYGAIIENAVGSGAADRITGNDARNVLDGGAGNDALFGGAGNDRLSAGAGADRLEGEAGNDVLIYAADDMRLSGGTGFDTVKVGGNLDLRTVAGTTLVDVERLNLTGSGNTLTLNASAILDLSTTSNTLMVLGDAGDTVNIVGGFVDKGITDGFHRYKSGTAILLVDVEIDVV